MLTRILFVWFIRQKVLVAGLGFEKGLDESSDGCGLTDVSIIAGSSLQTRWDEFQYATATRRLIHRIKAGDYIQK